jgi:hypothetical protein
LIIQNFREKKKEKKLPEQLNCAVKYDFTKKTIVLCFSENEWDWSKVSIQGIYYSADKNIPIVENQFEYVEIENEYVYNFIEKQAKFSKMFKVTINKIDRHVLMKQFSVKLGYTFLEDVDWNHFATEYFFDVRSCPIISW